MRVYESQQETTGKVPGVIVIIEAVGINRHIREVADKPSGKGYVPVALVLHHRLGSNP
jgi:carboxymethylenebutenolidase